MKKVEDIIARHYEIISLVRNKKLSLEEINKYLFDSELGVFMNERTFRRDVIAIENLYGITIAYNRSQNYYYIDFESDGQDASHLLEAFDMVNALRNYKKNRNYIQFNRRRPHGTHQIAKLHAAIVARKKVQFEYKKHWEDYFTQRTISPILLRQSGKFWYLLGLNTDGELRTFALDRMSNLKQINYGFDYPTDMDIDKMYEQTYGIDNPDYMDPENIVLKFEHHQGLYTIASPIHKSQKVVEHTPDYITIELYLKPTHDFIMEILSYGNWVKVLEPKSLQERIVKELKGNLLQYGMI